MSIINGHSILKLYNFVKFIFNGVGGSLWFWRRWMVCPITNTDRRYQINSTPYAANAGSFVIIGICSIALWAMSIRSKGSR